MISLDYNCKKNTDNVVPINLKQKLKYYRSKLSQLAVFHLDYSINDDKFIDNSILDVS